MRLHPPRLPLPAARGRLARSPGKVVSRIGRQGNRLSSALRSVGRRLRDSGLLTLLAWVGVIGLLFADSMYVQDHSAVPYASVVVGAITMTPIALLLLGLPPLAAWGVSALTAILYPLVAVMPNPNIWPYTPLQLLVA